MVPLASFGELPVRGAWGDPSDGKPTILCIHDFGHDGSQFDAVLAALGESAHILAPSFGFKSEKFERGDEVMGPLVATVLELLTWLGVGKCACVYGVDFGACVAVIRHRTLPVAPHPRAAEMRPSPCACCCSSMRAAIGCVLLPATRVTGTQTTKQTI